MSYSKNSLCAILELVELLSSRTLEQQDSAVLSAMQQSVSLLSDMVPSSPIWKLYWSFCRYTLKYFYTRKYRKFQTVTNSQTRTYNACWSLMQKQYLEICPPGEIWKISESNVESNAFLNVFKFCFYLRGSYLSNRYIHIIAVTLRTVGFIIETVKWSRNSVVILQSGFIIFHNTCQTVSGSSLHQHFFLCTG